MHYFAVWFILERLSFGSVFFPLVQCIYSSRRYQDCCWCTRAVNLFSLDFCFKVMLTRCMWFGVFIYDADNSKINLGLREYHVLFRYRETG
ncbi:hypothetical protein FPQ18DRAFT_7682 [Pyronema domesticum]|nr:hypothetical protein FPQ18DRAFT_7682 [Pyronema domesticum]